MNLKHKLVYPFLFVASLATALTACGGGSEDTPDNTGNTGGTTKPTVDIFTQLPTSDEIKSIPTPPAGQRWILNAQYSDEFNDTALDDTKWLDYHPTWNGREPGLFQPENVKVEDGYLKLWGKKLDEPVVITNWNKTKSTYDIGCAAVVSKEQTASYGYYECSFKASRSYLSSTFWLSTRGAAFEGPVNPGDKYSLELDICECIGETGDFDGSWFADGMHSNTHYWFTPEGGAKQDLRGPKYGIKIYDDKKPSEAFHTYGCWWRDAKTATFYLNNGEGHDATFNTQETDTPFNQSMGLNLVSETYPFPWISLPTDEQLADKDRCTTLYDWVRAYVLKPVTEAHLQVPTTMFEEHIHLAEARSRRVVPSSTLSVNVHYTANQDRSMYWEVYNEKSEKIKSGNITAYGGYGNHALKLPVEIESGKKYAVIFSLVPSGQQDRSAAFESDSFIVTGL